MTAARSVPPRFWLGLLLTAALHVAIVWMFAQHGQLRSDAPREQRAAIQWLLPMRKAAPSAPRPAAQAPATTSKPRRQPPKPVAAGSAAAPASEPQAITLPADPPDPFAAPAAPTPGAGDIMAQARKDIGKIDRDLRKAYPERGTPPESRQARLERAFDAAHDAVPPKWYQAAKTVEITPPNAHTRMYRVVTALITYCISISEDGRKSYTTCPK